MKIDWSKARAIHSLYGHHTFMRYMRQAKKKRPWVLSICKHLECKESV